MRAETREGPAGRRPREARGISKEASRDEGAGEGRSLKKYAIPFAVIAAIILIAAVLFILANSGSGIGSILIGNTEFRDRDDAVYPDETYPETLYVPLIASSNGLGKAKGTATIEVSYADDPTVLYTEKVGIKDDTGSTWIHMDRFVKGNGIYKLTAKAGGDSDTRDINIYSVTEGLDLTLAGENRDDPPFTHSYVIGYKIAPVDADGDNLRSAPMPFDVRATLVGPSVDDVETQTWPNRDSYIIEKEAEHIMKGDYLLTVVWTNLLCHPDSPFRTLTVTKAISVDSAPYADLGPDQVVTLVGGSANVSFDASGSKDDGRITEYRWDFGDGATRVTTSPYATHMFTAAGEYTVSVVAVDDSGQLSNTRWGGTCSIIVE